MRSASASAFILTPRPIALSVDSEQCSPVAATPFLHSTGQILEEIDMHEGVHTAAIILRSHTHVILDSDLCISVSIHQLVTCA